MASVDTVGPAGLTDVVELTTVIATVPDVQRQSGPSLIVLCCSRFWVRNNELHANENIWSIIVGHNLQLRVHHEGGIEMSNGDNGPFGGRLLGLHMLMVYPQRNCHRAMIVTLYYNI